MWRRKEHDKKRALAKPMAAKFNSQGTALQPGERTVLTHIPGFAVGTVSCVVARGSVDICEAGTEDSEGGEGHEKK